MQFFLRYFLMSCVLTHEAVQSVPSCALPIRFCGLLRDEFSANVLWSCAPFLINLFLIRLPQQKTETLPQHLTSELCSLRTSAESHRGSRRALCVYLMPAQVLSSCSGKNHSPKDGAS